MCSGDVDPEERRDWSASDQCGGGGGGCHAVQRAMKRARPPLSHTVIIIKAEEKKYPDPHTLRERERNQRQAETGRKPDDTCAVSLTNEKIAKKKIKRSMAAVGEEQGKRKAAPKKN